MDRRPARADFRLFRPVQARWGDNDVYGHVNNVVHYAWFDTVVNAWLIEAGLVDPTGAGGDIFLVAETGCRYFAPLAYPEAIEIGMAVERIGTSSVVWRLGAFAAGSDLAASGGRFVHVRVSRGERRPAPLDAAARSALERLLAPAGLSGGRGSASPGG